MHIDVICTYLKHYPKQREPADGGIWADAAKDQSAIVRASLENQVTAKMDAKTVENSRLEWSAAEDVTDLHGSPHIDEDAPRLNQEASVLRACIGKKSLPIICKALQCLLSWARCLNPFTTQEFFPTSFIQKSSSNDCFHGAKRLDGQAYEAYQTSIRTVACLP